jgi:hypothetical protein
VEGRCGGFAVGCVQQYLGSTADVVCSLMFLRWNKISAGFPSEDSLTEKGRNRQTSFHLREIASVDVPVVNGTDGIPAWSWISRLYLCSTRLFVSRAPRLFSPSENSHTARCLFPLRFIQTFRELPTYIIQIKPLTFSITHFLHYIRWFRFSSTSVPSRQERPRLSQRSGLLWDWGFRRVS